MTFKYDGNQQVWLEGKPVTVFGRTEFFHGKQPRYYVQGEGGESWVNEDCLSDIVPIVEGEQTAPVKSGIRGKKSIRYGKL